VLLASVVAAIASIAVALVSVTPSGSASGPAARVGAQAPLAGLSPAGTSQAGIAITGLLTHRHPPPPGELYIWTGTVRGTALGGTAFGASVYVVDEKHSGGWLVSPAATISENGTWTVRWVLSPPPVEAQWTAVMVFQDQASGSGAPGCNSLGAPSGCTSPPGGSASPPGVRIIDPRVDLSFLGPDAPEVTARATYQRLAKFTPPPLG
jgi:hypothetical protein